MAAVAGVTLVPIQHRHIPPQVEGERFVALQALVNAVEAGPQFVAVELGVNAPDGICTARRRPPIRDLGQSLIGQAEDLLRIADQPVQDGPRLTVACLPGAVSIPVRRSLRSVAAFPGNCSPPDGPGLPTAWGSKAGAASPGGCGPGRGKRGVRRARNGNWVCHRAGCEPAKSNAKLLTGQRKPKTRPGSNAYVSEKSWLRNRCCLAVPRGLDGPGRHRPPGVCAADWVDKQECLFHRESACPREPPEWPGKARRKGWPPKRRFGVY